MMRMESTTQSELLLGLLWACCGPADHCRLCSPAVHLLTTACPTPLLRAARVARCGTAALRARMPTGGRAGTDACARHSAWCGKPRKRSGSGSSSRRADASRDRSEQD